MKASTAALYAILLGTFLMVFGCSDPSNGGEAPSQAPSSTPRSVPAPEETRATDNQSLPAQPTNTGNYELRLVDNQQLRYSVMAGMPELINQIKEGALPELTLPFADQKPQPTNQQVFADYEYRFDSHELGAGHRGFSIHNTTSGTRQSEWEFPNELAQEVIDAAFTNTNSGSFLVLISRSLLYLSADRTPLLLKPGLPSPQQAPPLNITWVNISDPQNPITESTLQLTGHDIVHYWQDGTLFMLQSYLPWAQGLVNPSAPGSEPNVLEHMATTWKPSPLGAQNDHSLPAPNACLSDQHAKAVVHHLVAVDLHNQALNDAICIHTSAQEVSLDRYGTLHLSNAIDSSTEVSMVHSFQLSVPIEYRGSVTNLGF